MGAMDEAVDALNAAGLTDVKVMIGGAPLSAEYATNLAVNYSEDAVASVDLADALRN
jgi:methanogenic corrinoid protein MtbC1